MPTLGLVVEGTYDGVVFRELIQKCLGGNIDVVIRLCRTKVERKFPGFLEEFRYAKGETPVDKALVIRDADNRNPDELIEKMRGKIINRGYPFPVKFCIVVQELETWLLADEKAISKVTQEYSGKTVSRVSEPLEAIVDPKERLKQILSGARVDYTREVARKIAAAASLDRIQDRCPSFRSFHQAIQDC